uniref:palmitoyl-protein hydrolase n=1 Tax=Bursaphelenchus xylophilus TaxID=6326 RepID=A0A1I7S8S9_BURXY
MPYWRILKWCLLFSILVWFFAGTLFSSIRASFESCFGLASSRMASTIAGTSPYETKAVGQHKSTLIFFHGLGDQGVGWSQILSIHLNKLGVKVVCPNAASRPVTLNFGMQMPAWYDLKGLSPNSEEDAPGIASATEYAHSLIQKELSQGIPADKIFIGGFSMGGALAIHAGLTFSAKLAGIVSLSGFLLQRDTVEGLISANKQTPAFLGHGRNDPLVPLTFGQMTEAKLKTFNPNVTFKTYNCDHSTTEEEIADVAAFVQKQIN